METAQIHNAIIAGNVHGIEEVVKAALDEKQDPQFLISEVLIKAMDVVGLKMQRGEMFFPEVLAAAEATKIALTILNTALGGERKFKGRVLLGTVAGDLHDIGKKLVGMILESGGFEIIDIGVDVPVEAFQAAIHEYKPQIVGISALLTSTMQAMRETVQAIKKAGLDCKVIVGGAPIDQQFADEIGADAYGADAAEALDICKELCQPN
jgi:5-methyltetrahydrofolate--homocysteine methyltransferase